MYQAFTKVSLNTPWHGEQLLEYE